MNRPIELSMAVAVVIEWIQRYFGFLGMFVPRFPTTLMGWAGMTVIWATVYFFHSPLRRGLRRIVLHWGFHVAVLVIAVWLHNMLQDPRTQRWIMAWAAEARSRVGSWENDGGGGDDEDRQYP